MKIVNYERDYFKGLNSSIEANEVIVGRHVHIGDNVKIKVKGTLVLGDCTVIQDNCIITCQEFSCGEYLFMAKNVEIGRGGCNNPDAIVKIGDHVGIFENTVINPNSPVTIGNDVGIGDGVMIWTHGAWLDITKGFPADFGPVTIGNDVWLPARSVVLPNTTIGDNVVIGINSVVNKDLPSGCLAAGIPCKILRENMYPKALDVFEIKKLLDPILDRWYSILLPHKGIVGDIFLKYDVSENRICLQQENLETYFNIDNKTIEGYENEISEDLRDFLRRNGIKFYNGKPFKSI